MFEIVFLGTSASAPSVYRGLSASIILAGEYRFLIDCGEGTQRQILRSGLGFKKLKHILLTHGHLDHILGLGGLLSTFVRWEGDMDEIEIWGGKSVLDRVQALIYGVVLRNEIPPIPIHLIDLKPGQVISTKAFTVSAFPVEHRGRDNFGFIFQEHNRRPFDADRATELGIPNGPERAQLVRGENITLASGKLITPDMVLGDEIQGTKLVYVGDTGRTDNLVNYVTGADTLVIEATFLKEDQEIAGQFGHITAEQAATLAKEHNVKTLILNHISRRYRERDVVSEARSIFPDTFVARDLDHFIIHRGDKAEQKFEQIQESEE